MGGAWHDLQPLFTVQLTEGRTVQRKDFGVRPADNEQGWSENFAQCIIRHSCPMLCSPRRDISVAMQSPICELCAQTMALLRAP